jgi:hypothetical protein
MYETVARQREEKLGSVHGRSCAYPPPHATLPSLLAVNAAIARFEKRLKIDRQLQNKIKKVAEELNITFIFRCDPKNGQTWLK